MEKTKEKNKYADYDIYDIMGELEDIPRISTILEDIYYSHIGHSVPYFADVHNFINNLDVELEVINDNLDEDVEWLSVNICSKMLFECARHLGEIVIDGEFIYFVVRTGTYSKITQNPIAIALLIRHIQTQYAYMYMAHGWCREGYFDHEFLDFLHSYQL